MENRRAQLLDQLNYALAVPNVEFVMNKARNLPNRTSLIQSCIALGPKKNLSLIVVDTMDRASLAGKVQAGFGANEA